MCHLQKRFQHVGVSCCPWLEWQGGVNEEQGKQDKNTRLDKWTQMLKLRLKRQRKRRSGVCHRSAGSDDSSSCAGGSGRRDSVCSAPCTAAEHPLSPVGVAAGGHGHRGAQGLVRVCGCCITPVMFRFPPSQQPVPVLHQRSLSGVGSWMGWAGGGAGAGGGGGSGGCCLLAPVLPSASAPLPAETGCGRRGERGRLHASHICGSPSWSRLRPSPWLYWWEGKENNSKIQPRRAHQERKNLPIFTLSRLLNNTRLLIWLLSLH